VKQATKNREGHRQNICHTVCMSLVPKRVASFKCIICGTQVPQSFSQVGNSTLGSEWHSTFHQSSAAISVWHKEKDFPGIWTHT
jgi:hypothetical protein